MKYRLFLSVATAGVLGSTAFTYTLGADVQKPISEHWQLGLVMSLLTGVKANWVVLLGRP